MKFEKLIKKIAKILEELKIQYCITGGYAVSVWGRPRATFDIDIIIFLKTKDLKLFLKKIRSLSRAGYIEENLIRESMDKGGEFNFIHPESGLKIDFWAIKENDLRGMNGIKRRVRKILGGQSVYFISPEDLILSKFFWFREGKSPRHLEDIKSIISISRNKIDFDYLKREAEKQGVGGILGKL